MKTDDKSNKHNNNNKKTTQMYLAAVDLTLRMDSSSFVFRQ